MADLIFIALTVAFFALAALMVRICDRIIGPDEDSDLAVRPDEPREAAVR